MYLITWCYSKYVLSFSQLYRGILFLSCPSAFSHTSTSFDFFIYAISVPLCSLETVQIYLCGVHCPSSSSLVFFLFHHIAMLCLLSPIFSALLFPYSFLFLFVSWTHQSIISILSDFHNFLPLTSINTYLMVYNWCERYTCCRWCCYKKGKSKRSTVLNDLPIDTRWHSANYQVLISSQITTNKLSVVCLAHFITLKENISSFD